MKKKLIFSAVFVASSLFAATSSVEFEKLDDPNVSSITSDNSNNQNVNVTKSDDLSLLVDEPSDKKLETTHPEVTVVERLLAEGDVDSVMKMVDFDRVRGTHLAGLGFIKGRILSIRGKIASNQTVLDQKSRLILKAFEVMNADLSMKIQQVASKDYSIENLVKYQLAASAKKNCKTSRYLVDNFISATYQCGNIANIFRLQPSQNGEYHITGMKTNEVLKTERDISSIFDKLSGQ